MPSSKRLLCLALYLNLLIGLSGLTAVQAAPVDSGLSSEEESLVVSESTAQEPSIEDLRNMDWVKLNELIDKAWKEKDFVFAEKALDAATIQSRSFDLEDPRAYKVYQKQAKLFYKIGNLKKTVESLKESEDKLANLPEDLVSKHEKLKFFYRFARILNEAGLPLKGMKTAEKAEAIMNQFDSPDLLLEPRIYNLIGKFYKDNGKLNEADEKLKQAMTLVNISCPSIADGENQTFKKSEKALLALKGEILNNQSDLKSLYPGDKESSKIAKEALKYMRLGYGKSRKNLNYVELDIFNKVKTKSGGKPKAKDFIAILPKLEAEFGKESLIVADLLGSIGTRQFKENKFPESIKSFNKSLLIKQKILPETSIKIAGLYELLALGYLRSIDSKSAASVYKKAYDICKVSCGEKSPQLASCAEGLGVVYAATGAGKQAEIFLLEAWKINEAHYGRDNERVLANLTNLGAVFAMQRRYKQAMQYTYWAYQITEKLYGKEDSRLGNAAANLAQLYMQRREMKSAQKYFDVAYRIETKEGKNRPGYAIFLKQLAHFYIYRGKVQKAANYYKEALAVEEKAFGLTHPTTYTTLKKYHKLLKAMGRTNEANVLSSRYRKAHAAKMRRKR